MKASSNGLCGNSPVTVHAFADNELNPKEWLDFKDHLSACPNCFTEYRRILALKALFKHKLLQHRAPVPLRMEIASALQAASAGPLRPGNFPRLSRPNSIWKEWKQINRLVPPLAASLIIAVSMVFYLRGPALPDEIIASYKRSLVMSLPSNTPPTAAREEKAELAGNPSFVLAVPDLSGSGFTYKGARLDRIAQRSMAVLIYSHGSHVIDLFIWPSESEPLGIVSKEGFNIIHWTRSGLKFCAISTMTARELSKFREVFASKLPA